MKVKELIELLVGINPEMEIVMSADSEGNSYSPLRVVDTDSNNYDSDEREIGLRSLTPDLEKQGYSEEDVMENGEPVVVLWP
jgi:hypothetical protein